jgi:hypothetical protein
MNLRALLIIDLNNWVMIYQKPDVVHLLLQLLQIGGMRS